MNLLFNKTHLCAKQLIVLLVLIVSISGCNSEAPLNDEQQVRAVIDAMEMGAEERSLSSMMEHVSLKYRDSQGNDHKAVKALIQFQFIRNQSINVFSKIGDLEIVGDTATVEMSVAMASGLLDLSDEANRLRADSFRFSLLFSRENQVWKLQSSSWQRGW